MTLKYYQYKSNRNRFSGFIIFLFSFLISFQGIGQEEIRFYLFGKVSPDLGSLHNTWAYIYQDNQILDTLKISSTGKYEYECDFNHNYLIRFESTDFVSQQIRLNAIVPEKVMKRNNKFPPFQFDPVLFKKFPSMDYNQFDGPLVTIAYNERIDHFEYDYDYYDDFIAQTKKENSKAQRLAENNSQKNEEGLAKEKSYQQAIKNADAQFDQKNLAKAKTFYEQALIFVPDESYPKKRIAEIEGLFAEDQKKLDQQKELDKKYSALIAEADILYKQKNYSQAKEKYQESLTIKPKEEYPRYKIEDIETLFILIEKDEKYKAAIKLADDQFEAKEYEPAKQNYTKASGIKPNEIYPKNKIIEIDRLVKQLALAEAAAKSTEENYQAAITKADQQFSAKTYTEAKTSYQSASKIKPTEAYPKDQISKIDQILSDLAKAEADLKARDEAYNKAIATADKAFKLEEFAGAKISYQEASGMKPEENYPKDQISKIEQILAERAQKEADIAALNKNYNELIAKADADFTSKNYENSKSGYLQALQLKPSEKYPKDRIAEIEKILQELALAETAAKLTGENYQAAITKADQQFSAKTYFEAKTSYQSASKIKPAEVYPKDQISKIDQILADLAKAEADLKARDEAYNKAIATADKAFKLEEFAGAKISYQEASGMKPEENYPKDQISKIEQILAERAQKEADIAALNKNYNELIAKADADFTSKNYENSKSGYLQALQLKPSEKYPKDRIAEIEKILQELALAEAAAKSTEENYQAAITKADQQFSAKTYTEAKTSYQSASKIKPTEAYPKDQISKIDQILSDLAKAEADLKARDEAYNKAIATADKAFKLEEFAGAKISYQEASGMKPEENYPKDQISKIEQILAERAQKEADIAALNKNYNELIAKADADFTSKNYENSKSGYLQALQLKPSEKYPKDRIAEIEKILQELALAETAAKLTGENYQAAITKADQQFSAKTYFEAKTSYQSASKIKPAEIYPKDQISKIDQILADLAKAEADLKARDEAYNKAIAAADKAFKMEEFAGAKISYQDASGVKPDQNYPKDQISKIEQILAERAQKEADLAALNKNYNDLIAKADADFTGKNYENSKSGYQQALQLKPSEKYPKDRIAEIEKILQELALAEAAAKSIEENYQSAITKAEQQFLAKAYIEAKTSYQSASKIKPAEVYPKDQISKIDQILADLAKTEADLKARDEAYNKAIAAADKAFAKEEFAGAKISYQEASGLKPDESYPKDQISKIEQILAERAKKEADIAALNKNYNDLIAKADANFTGKNYENSKSRYQQALQLKPSEKYPKDRIAEIEKILHEIALAEAAAKSTEENYQSAITKADQQFLAKAYIEAKASYLSASKIKPTEKYPKDQISKIDQILADIAKAEADLKARDEAYNKAIAAADKAFKMEEFSVAKISYQEASGLKPDENYPKDQISKIEQILAERAQKEADLAALSKNYSDLIAKADADFTGKNYENSKSGYQQALQLKPSEKYPKDRIAEIEKILQELALAEAAAKSIEENYQSAITKADQQFLAKAYIEAKTSYQSASKIKPAEVYPKDQISKIDQILADLAKTEADLKARDEAYNKAIAAANKAFQMEEFAGAKSGYQEASGLKPDESYPKDQIAKIDQILAERAQKEADLAALNKNYNELIAKADADFTGKNYENSKSGYQQALQLKPSEKYPKDRITEIEKILQELALAEAAAKSTEENYQAAITKADQQFSAKTYFEAKTSYQSASKIKPAEVYPKDQISKIDQILADIAKAEADLKALDEAYNKAIAEADKAFKMEEFSVAKISYQEASGVKPDENYPKDQISKIEQILAERAQKQADIAALNKNYNELIAKADADFTGKNYENSKSGYQQALQLKPSEKYPKDRIAEIEKILQELALAEAAAKSTEENYQAAITKADQQFSAKTYFEAKTSYQSASKIKPTEVYPKDQISKIDQILADLAKAEADLKARDEAYNKAIATADKAFKLEEFSVAKISYQEASGVKPEERYPKDQISKIDQILAERAKQEADIASLNKNYAELIAKADADFIGKNYENSKSGYQQAVQLKPSEKYPKDRIAEIEKILQELAESEKVRLAKQKKYEELIKKADDSFRKEKLDLARFDYIASLEILPAEPYPTSMIAKIDSLLMLATNKERLLAIERAYNEAIGEADKLFGKEKWDMAKDAYLQATEIKPAEKYPKQKIDEINQILNKIEIEKNIQQKETNYAAFIKEADQQFKEAVYQKALGNYQAASIVFPEQQYPKEKIDAINKLLSELAAKQKAIEQENQYNEYIQKADKHFNQKEYWEAKNSYLSASEVKPTETYPKERIALIDEILQQQKANEAELAGINAAYEKAIEIADFEFNSQQYEASRADYQKAISLKPTATYPREQIRKIEDILARQKLKQSNEIATEDSYFKALERGDKALGFSEFTVARFYYNQAQDLRPYEELPKKKLEEVQRLWDKIQQAKLDAEYGSNIEQGDTHLKEEAFIAARFYYYKASELKPEEELPKQKIKTVETAIQQKELNETFQSYLKTIEMADQFLKEKDLSIAEYYYETAMQIKGNEAYPVKKLDEIKNLKATLELAEKQTAYNQAIDRADAFYMRQEYTAARYFYYKALEFSDKEEYPKKRIDEIKQFFDPDFRAKQEAYNKAIQKADSAFEHKDYPVAKTWYEKAINIKESDDYSRKRLDKIKALTKPAE